jgi:hypothetical protein
MPVPGGWFCQLSNGGFVMERFLKKYQDYIAGTISGFDRVVFRGTLRSISHVNGLEIFLSSQHVLHKDFGPFAQGLSNQIKTHAEEVAKKVGRPVLYLASTNDSKEDIARRIMEEDAITEGLICVLTCVEPCKSFIIRRDPKSKHLLLVPQERKCLHLYFYYMDREFGLMHVRIQTWLPFTIQVYINGREWLARQMNREGIKYEQSDNCFTYIGNFPRAQQLCDRLCRRKWAPLLNAWARRINPYVFPKSDRSLRDYYWSIRQGEYATDVVFRDKAKLREVYPQLIRHAIDHFGSDDVLRFLGRRMNSRSNGEVRTELRRREEGVRIKHWVEENSIKMYDKQGIVLRVETTINNPRRYRVRRMGTRQGRRAMTWLPLRRGVADMRRRVQLSHAANGRYLEALSMVEDKKPICSVLDPVSQRLTSNNRSYRALRPISHEEAKWFQALLRGEFQLQGFRNRDLRRHLFGCGARDPKEAKQLSGRITRMLCLLREHGLIYKVARTNYYRVTKHGYLVMTTALRCRAAKLPDVAA